MPLNVCLEFFYFYGLNSQINNSKIAAYFDLLKTNLYLRTKIYIKKLQTNNLSLSKKSKNSQKTVLVFSLCHGLRTPVRKSPQLHGQKSTPTFLDTAKSCFVCHIGPNFQISLIYAFIGCP